MKIAVCDDCQEDIQQLKVFLYGHDVRTYFQAEELLADVENQKIHFDLYLLDIYITDSMDGIELAKEVRRLDADAPICFISTSNDFYREAYDLYAVQYLLKPVQEEKVRKLLEHVAGSLERNKEQKLSYKWKGKTGAISYGEILYISSEGHILQIYCKDGTIQKCNGKLDELERKIDSHAFCRCHQSFLVNLYHVEVLSGRELVISDNRIPISRRYYAEVKKRYQEILFEEVE